MSEKLNIEKHIDTPDEIAGCVMDAIWKSHPHDMAATSDGFYHQLREFVHEAIIFAVDSGRQEKLDYNVYDRNQIYGNKILENARNLNSN